jgi:hypothetical protein
MANQQLGYRVEKSTLEQYKQVCQSRLIEPGKLIEKFMDVVIKHPELIAKIINPQD